MTATMSDPAFPSSLLPNIVNEITTRRSEVPTTSPSLSEPDRESSLYQSLSFTVPTKRSKKHRARCTGATRKRQLQNASKMYVQKKPAIHRTAVSKYQKKYTNVNREAVARYQHAHPEVNREAVARYQQAHPEVNREAVARYQQAHPEVNREAVARYQQAHPEVNREAVARYQQAHPEMHRTSQSRYEKNNPGRRVERKGRSWKTKAYSGMAYDIDTEYEIDSTVALGSMSNQCRWCNALKWKEEAPGICCSAGKVQLSPYEQLPEPLYSLIMNIHPEHGHFMNVIRKYNSCFQMTSFGAKQIIKDGFMPTFKVQGQVYHLVGSLLPAPQKEPQFLQIYFVGEDDREIKLRCSNFTDVKPGLVRQLQGMLHTCNAYIRDLKVALDKVPAMSKTFKVVINAERKPPDSHRGRFNAPTSNEVALVMVGQQFEKRDIILESHDNSLQRISEIHRSYDALQYPLLFCRGEDGYSISLPQRDPATKLTLKKTVSAASFYSFRIMIRQGETNHLVYFRSLFSQFLVDMYAKIETERLTYIRKNQAQLRADSYIHLRDAIGRQDVDGDQLGLKVVLPSSFTGGPRYMHERTQDAMTYVRQYGRPDLFSLTD